MKKPNVAGMDFPAYRTWFNSLPYMKQYELQRKAGFAVVDPDYQQLRKAAARSAGLPDGSEPAAILFTMGGGIGCAECGGKCEEPEVGEAGDCAAVMFPISEINTDPARFQNRTDAFSELSAESVAQNYDPNKFDPVVLWRDAKSGRVYVLSGHSRLEGRKRRKDQEIESRFFQGTEAEAIQFARVDANRSANQENLVEDLQAYRLMRDGDKARSIKPSKKAELERVFKGKHTKLEAWSNLNPAGSFIRTLQQDNRSEFPHIERLALWVGQLRREHEHMTNTHEDDCFNFFYGETKNLKLTREEFFEVAGKRLAWGKARLFPECDRGGCSELKDLAKRGPQAEAYKLLEQLSRDRDQINERLRTTSRSGRIYTSAEREKYLALGKDIDQEVKWLQRDLGQAEAAPALFGPGESTRQFIPMTINRADYKDAFQLAKLIASHVEASGFNDQGKQVGFRIYAGELKMLQILHDLKALEPQLLVQTDQPMYLLTVGRGYLALVTGYLCQKKIDHQVQLPARSVVV